MIICLALLASGAIAFVTLCPIGLRPHLAAANQERFAAYYGLGVLVTLAMPRKALHAAALMVLLGAGLEAAQLYVPGRDAAVQDAAFKILGGLVGVMVASLGFSATRLVKRMMVLGSAPAQAGA